MVRTRSQVGAMLTLADKIVQSKPRETSGARSANRFDYQKDWIVCLLLDLHQKGKDYLVICDYHEDIMLFDRESDPGTVAFFQIKTKAGKHWTLGNLLKRKKASSGLLLSSPLAKLYLNHLIDPDSTHSLNFVSNAYFQFKRLDNPDSISRTKITCGDLMIEEITKIRNQLSEECESQCQLPNVPVLTFEVSSLSLHDHSGHAKGKVAEFLDGLLHGKKLPVVAVYRALYDEVRRKTNVEANPATFDELRDRKGIGKTLLEGMLVNLAAVTDLDAIWTEIRERLVHEQMSALSVKDIGRAWSRYEIDRMDASNETLGELRMRVIGCSQEIIGRNKDVSLSELANQVCQRTVIAGATHGYEPSYVKAMVLMEAYVHTTL